MPDATGLELIAQRCASSLGEDAVAGTSYYREQATLEVAPARVHDVLALLKKPRSFERLMSVHGCDYLPDEPRLGVHYQLLSMERLDRLNVKTRLGVDEPEAAAAWSTCSPRRTSRSARSTTSSASMFEGHPDLRRILMPEDYEGYPSGATSRWAASRCCSPSTSTSYPRWYD